MGISLTQEPYLYPQMENGWNFIFIYKEWLNINKKNGIFLKGIKSFWKHFLKIILSKEWEIVSKISSITQDFDIRNVKYGVVFKKTKTDK